MLKFRKVKKSTNLDPQNFHYRKKRKSQNLTPRILKKIVSKKRRKRKFLLRKDIVRKVIF